MFPSITSLIDKAELTPLPYIPIFDLSTLKDIKAADESKQFQPNKTPNMNTSCRRNSVKFTKEEDNKLEYAIKVFGLNNWSYVAKAIGTKTVRQCRERWYNQLNPQLTKGRWTPQEDILLIQKYQELGPKWVLLAKYITNKSPVSIKLRWKRLSKKSNMLQAPVQQIQVPMKTPVYL